MEDVWDLVIIGAGPGGGSAALHAARAGLRTLVLEDHPEIGTPVHCGECLSKLATEELALDLPDEVIALEVRGIRMLFPDGTSRVLSEPGYVLEKHLFERWLIAEAVAGGVEIRLGHTVTEMKRDSQLENRIGNWILEGRGSTFPIQARSIIDASGVAGVASKLLDLSDPVEVIAGFQYELQDVENDGYLDFYLWPADAPHGYVWMIPKAEGRANVGLVTTDKRGAIRYLDGFIERSSMEGKVAANPPWRPDGQKVRPFGGTIPISGPRSTTVADGLILIGDAAGFTSPLFEGGSHLALWSGRRAVEILASALEDGDLSAERLSRYEDAWKAAFPPYHRILDGKERLYDLTDEELSILGSCMPKEMDGMGPLAKLMVGVRILLRRPSLFFKGGVKVLRSFGYSRAKYFGW